MKHCDYMEKAEKAIKHHEHEEYKHGVKPLPKTEEALEMLGAGKPYNHHARTPMHMRHKEK
jgi:hypothetical protein